MKKNTWLSPPCWLNVDLAAVAQGYPKKTARLNECAKDETLRTCIWPNIKKDPAVPSHLVVADDLLVLVGRQYLIIAISSRLLIGRNDHTSAFWSWCSPMTNISLLAPFRSPKNRAWFTRLPGSWIMIIPKKYMDSIPPYNPHHPLLAASVSLWLFSGT